MPIDFAGRSTLFIISALTTIVINSCGTSSGKSFVPSLPGHPESRKEVFVLHKKLLEISGLNVLPNNSYAAINDEDGEVYFFQLPDDKQSLQTVPFGKEADYEDLAQVGKGFWVMESNGDLHFVEPGNPPKTEQFKFSRDTKVEFESLVHYPRQNKLILITKEHRFPEESIFAFSFDLTTKTFQDSPVFKIPMQEVLIKVKDLSAQFKPSAAAIHPVLNKLFILASVGKVMLQCSLDGKVEKAYALNPSQFQQPEGISFASNGDMYISNEGLEGKATILKFPFQAK